ncbi:hypothetical protein [Tenacibaculum xiamenense]|uniref:hypothetical protein n=1 Tax=Tenacibaculum xiamenense TaxID=1261553 RepID=UPI003895F514
MRKTGSTLVFFGILAIVLNFVNMVPRVLMWIYSWGETTAWGIKIGIVVLGAILWLIGGKEQEEEALE